MQLHCSVQLKHALAVCAQLGPGASATLKFFQEDPFLSACRGAKWQKLNLELLT